MDAIPQTEGSPGSEYSSKKIRGIKGKQHTKRLCVCVRERETERDRESVMRSSSAPPSVCHSF